MLSYCLKCIKNTESTNPKVETDSKQKNNFYIKLCGLWQ